MTKRASLVAQLVKNVPAMQETWVQSLGREDPLEKEMATHSSILAWRIPWTEEPGGLQSVGFQKSDITWQLNHHQWLMRASQVALVGKYPLANAGDMRLGFDPWVGKIPYRTARQPTLVFLPGESYGQRRLVATAHKVAKSWTQLCTLWTWHSDLEHMHAMTNDIEHIFMCLLLICILLWKNIHFQLLSIYKLGCFCVTVVIEL